MSNQQLIAGPVFIITRTEGEGVIGKKIFVPVMSLVMIEERVVIVLGPEPHVSKIIHRGFETGQSTERKEREKKEEILLSGVLRIEDRDGKALWQQ